MTPELNIQGLGRLGSLGWQIGWASALVRAVVSREFGKDITYPYYAVTNYDDDDPGAPAIGCNDAFLARLFFSERAAQVKAQSYTSDEGVAMVLAYG